MIVSMPFEKRGDLLDELSVENKPLTSIMINNLDCSRRWELAVISRKGLNSGANIRIIFEISKYLELIIVKKMLVCYIFNEKFNNIYH